MPADLPPPFVCEVVRVHDGDSLTCADRTRIRVAGIQAPDYASSPPCRRNPVPATYTCDTAAAKRSRAIVERLVLRQRITCQPVDRSYQRVVAQCTLVDGRSLSCAAIAAGAAVRWDAYWRRYRMGECR